MKVVQIDWVDSACSLGWEGDERGKERKLCRIRTIGYLLHRDKDSILICGTRDKACDDNTNRIAIPTGCVKRLRYLKEIE